MENELLKVRIKVKYFGNKTGKRFDENYYVKTKTCTVPRCSQYSALMLEVSKVVEQMTINNEFKGILNNDIQKVDFDILN